MNKFLKIIFVLFLLGIICAIIVWVFIINKSHQNIEKAKIAYTVSAKDLYFSYSKNKKKSDFLYNDKVLVVTGVLNKIEKSDSLVIAEFIFEKDPMFGDKGVRCSMIKKFNQAMSQIKPGIMMKIKGQCKGFADDVILEECTILK